MATVSTVKEPPIRTLMAVSSKQELKNTEKVPRRKPVYPISAERELARDFLSISVIIRKTAKPYMGRGLMRMLEQTLGSVCRMLSASFWKSMEMRLMTRLMLML